MTPSGYLQSGLLRPTVAGIVLPTDLRAVLPSGLFADGMLAFVSSVSSVFAWDSTSFVADDGATVILPNDLAPVDPGRWVKVVFAGGGGLPVGVVPAFSFDLSGVFSGAVVPGYFTGPVVARAPFTIDTVGIVRRVAGSVGVTLVDVLKNGTTIYDGAGNRPNVLAVNGDYDYGFFSAFTPGANVFGVGDILEVELADVEDYEAGPPEGPEGLRVNVFIV